MAREFITAVEEKFGNEDQKLVEFTVGREWVGDDGVVNIDKRDMKARYPKDGQVALMMARMSRHASTADKVAGIIDFFVEVLDDADRQYIVDRLMDGGDPFGLNDVTGIMTYLMEEWGARPTK